MDCNRRSLNPKARLAAIVILIGLSIGMVAYSVGWIDFEVGPNKVNELAVTELSLTHSVVRDPDGKLVNPFEEAAEPQTQEHPEKTEPEEITEPVAPNKHEPEEITEPVAPTKQEPVVKKAAPKPQPKKPAVKKPTPSKSAPKPEPKPAPKPPGGGLACPT